MDFFDAVVGVSMPEDDRARVAAVSLDMPRRTVATGTDVIARLAPRSARSLYHGRVGTSTGSYFLSWLEARVCGAQTLIMDVSPEIGLATSSNGITRL